MTIAVDGYKKEDAALPGVQSSDWRLPSTDPRDEGKYLFRLHTLDIYFWTKDDANLFVKSAQATLRQEQMDIDYPVPTPHAEVVSPVVQKLENVAISDPAYQNGKTASSATSSLQPVAKAKELERENVNYTPLAYNPAAPPAPEKRTHREKTPPPPDAADGTGLTGATYDEMHHQQQQHHQTYQPGSILPPPPSTHGPAQASAQQAYLGAAATGAAVGAVAASQLGRHSQAASPASTGHSISTPPSSTAHHNYVPSASHPPAPQHPTAPNLDSPTAQILGRSYLTSPTQPLQHLQPQYADYLGQEQHQRRSSSQSRPHQAQSPPGGYSDYSYAASTSQAHTQAAYGGHPMAPYYTTGTGDHALHAQVYRPTEDEAAAGGSGGGGSKKKKKKEEEEEQQGRWEQKAEKAEKSLNRLLRKVEKKIG